MNSSTNQLKRVIGSPLKFFEAISHSKRVVRYSHKP